MPIIASLFKKINGVKTIIYPRTKEKAVYDDEGNRLDEKLKKIKETSEHAVSNISVEVTGTGNAVTDATYADGKIEMKKGASYLVSHPATESLGDNTGSLEPGSNGTFAVIDWIGRDAFGHITGINSKSVRMPTVPMVYDAQNVTDAGSALDARQGNPNITGTVAYKVELAMKKASDALEIRHKVVSGSSLNLNGLVNGITTFYGKVKVINWIDSTLENAIIISGRAVDGQCTCGQLCITASEIYFRTFNKNSQNPWVKVTGQTMNYYSTGGSGNADM